MLKTLTRNAKRLGMAALGAFMLFQTAITLAGAQTDTTCRNNASACRIEEFTNVLPSASFTSSGVRTSAEFEAQGFNGLRCVVNPTANLEAATITVNIQGKDSVPTTPVYWTLLSNTAANDTSAHAFSIGPGTYDETGVRKGVYLAQTYRITTSVASFAHSNPVVFSVDCARLP